MQLNILVKTVIQDTLMHLFEIFHNIMSVFTVTFDQFNAPFLSKSIIIIIIF